MKTGRILLADDDGSILEALAEILRDQGHDVTAVPDGRQAIDAVRETSFDVVVSDLAMPDVDGLEVLRRTRELAPQTLVVLITGNATIDTALAALREGAHDYLLKPLVFEEVVARLNRLLEYRSLAWESQVLRRQVDADFDFDKMIIGESRRAKEMLHLVRKVAPTNATVLITGESGVGKDVLARAIHHYSNRASAVFLPVNTSAIPENLLESQLFGHAKGSFTGAVTSQEGLFQRARGGTILLDEIGDLPLALQAKLLRAIEGKEILPIGTTTPVKVDIRIVAATNRDLPKAVSEGKFREDLYYRLNVVHIDIPPLRERRDDIPKLVEFLVQRNNAELGKAIKGVDNDTMKILASRPWKGNVRELDNVIEHAMIMAEGDWVTPADLPSSAPSDALSLPPMADNLKDAVHAFEKLHIERILRRAGSDKKLAAELLGVGLSSLYRKIDELGIREAE